MDPFALLRSSPALVAVRVAARDFPRAWRASVELPGDVMALLTRGDDEHEVALPGTPLAARSLAEMMLVRAVGIPLDLRLGRLLSRDGYPAEVAVSCGVRVMPERGELISFRRLVPVEGDPLTAARIEDVMLAAIRSGLEDSFSRGDMSSLQSLEGRRDLEAGTRRAIEHAAFACGMTADAGIEVRIDSPVYENLRRATESADQERRRIEASEPVRQAARQAQVRQAEHFTELLSRLRTVSAEAPEAEWPAALRSFADADRAQLLAAMFAQQAEAATSRALVVVAGDEVLIFDPPSAPAPTHRWSVAGEAGPPRSVHIQATGGEEPRIWIGGATGVYRLRIPDGGIEQTFLVRPVPSVRGGFNAVAVANGVVLASHSELGLHRWSMDDPGAPSRACLRPRTRRAQAVRAVQVLDDRCWCALDEVVVGWRLDEADDPPVVEYRGAGAQITALCVRHGEVFAGTAEGRVLRWVAGSLEAPERLHAGPQRPVASLCVIEREGFRRLFFTDTSSCVQARVLDDTTRFAYEASGQVLRRAAVAFDRVAALTDVRDRIILFDVVHPDRPRCVHSVARQTGHTVQDFAFLPA